MSNAIQHLEKFYWYESPHDTSSLTKGCRPLRKRRLSELCINGMIYLPLIAMAFFSCKSQELTSRANKVQKDSTGMYSYEICVQTKAKPGKLVINQTIRKEIKDSALVEVELIDSKNEPVQSGSVTFIVDTNGKGSLLLMPGVYKIDCKSIGCVTFSLDSLKLSKGEVKRIVVCLGEGGAFKMMEIKSSKPMTSKEIEDSASEAANR
jgi:hypothetical protein